MSKILQDRVSQILSRTVELLHKSNEQYNLEFNVSDVKIDFDLKGKSAGQANFRIVKSKIGSGGAMNSVRLRYNKEAIMKDFEHMLNDTVPHEVAHLVVPVEFSRTGRSQVSHGPKWKAVCCALGGTGETYHKMQLTKGRKVREWLYRLDSGKELNIKTNMHNKIQMGKRYVVGNDKEPIRPEHFIKQVK